MTRQTKTESLIEAASGGAMSVLMTYLLTENIDFLQRLLDYSPLVLPVFLLAVFSVGHYLVRRSFTLGAYDD